MPQTIALALVIDAVNNAGPHDGRPGPSENGRFLGQLMTEQQTCFFKRGQYSIGQARPKSAGPVYLVDMIDAIRGSEKDLAKDVHHIFKDANTFYFTDEQMISLAETLLRKYNPPADPAVAAIVPAAPASAHGVLSWPAKNTTSSRGWTAPRLVGPPGNAGFRAGASGKGRAITVSDPAGSRAGASGEGRAITVSDLVAPPNDAGASGEGSAKAVRLEWPNTEGHFTRGGAAPSVESRLGEVVSDVTVKRAVAIAEHKAATTELRFKDMEIESIQTRLVLCKGDVTMFENLLTTANAVVVQAEDSLKARQDESQQARNAEATSAAALAEAQVKFDVASEMLANFKRARRS